MQSSRSMDDLDRLIQYKQAIGNKLDAEKRSEIEADINLFSDAEQFRSYHAIGRFRATVCTIGTTIGAMTFLNGGRNGVGHMWRNPWMATAVFVGSWATWYQVWTRYAGYNSQKYNEF